MSQGITVSIQAKIEGWQDQIKQIQDALKNMKADTNISKSMTKDLKQVENMVSSLGKNLTQKLTSESQIDSFVGKMNDIERIFQSLGTSMQSVSFGDLKPEYITQNFQGLLNAIEAANSALSSGMETSLQGAIADSKELTKEFGKMKIDPKDLNMEQMREVLSTRGEGLAKDLQSAQKEAEKLKQEMQSAIQERDKLSSYIKNAGTNSNDKAMEMLGGVLPTNGTILDDKAIKDKRDQIRQSLLSIGISEGDLNKVLPSVDKLMHAAKWDQIPAKLAEYIDKTKVINENKLNFAQQDAKIAVANWHKADGAVIHQQALVTSNNQAQDALETLINTRVQQETQQLREELESLKAQLQGQATAGFKNTGSNISNNSSVALSQASKTAEQYNAALGRVKSAEQALGKLQGVVQRWFSIYAVVRMVSNAIKSVISTVKELDTTITDIAIVTNMSQDDLWGQMPKYTQLAREYGASISGAYKVSQLYYQQGLGMNDVMALTESTLKMARISGLEYADATNYMTNAVRSFKMEMTEASTVVDVYSAIAASSATSVSELATAMSKTASSAQAVGASFENTTAMMAVMIEATRESPENIGSAMKSIISRYGELKENKTGTDAEGEEYSLNKVDTALQSVGISIHDVNGEFRDFDDVIMELSESWDKIDKNTQRYIATVMAGNRQQSRFLALVSSGDRLKELSEEAANSEDASQLQFLKSLDSVDTKVQQLQTSIQALYTNSGIEKIYKNILDYGNAIVKTLDNVSDTQGIIGVISRIGTTFTALATLVSTVFTTMKLKFSIAQQQMTADAKIEAAKRELQVASEAEQVALTEAEKVEAHNRAEEAMTAKTKAEAEKRTTTQMKASNWKKNTGMIATGVGLLATTYAATLDENENRQQKALLTAGGGILSGVGTGLMMGGIPGMIMGAVTAIPSIIEAIGISTETAADRINKIKNDITNTSNQAIRSKDEYKTFTDQINKLKELKAAQNDSAEAKKAYLDASNEIAESYPELIGYIDAEGNKVIELTGLYQDLANEKAEAYRKDAIEASAARIKGATNKEYRINEMGLSVPKTKEGVPSWLSWMNYLGADFAADDKVYNQIGESISTGSNLRFAFGYNGGMSGNGADRKDFLQAIFHTDQGWYGERENGNIGTRFKLGLNQIGLTGEENQNLMDALVDDGRNIYERIGQYIEGLMEAGKNINEINTALTETWGSEVHFDNNIYQYRSRIKNSEQYIKDYGESVIKSENLTLFTDTAKELDLAADSAFENLFMQNEFQTSWEKWLTEEKKENMSVDPSDAWRRFAEQAKSNVEAAKAAYVKAIDDITDINFKNEIQSSFNNRDNQSLEDLHSLWLRSYKEDPNSALTEFLWRQLQDTQEEFDKQIASFTASKSNYGIDFNTRIDAFVEDFGRGYINDILSQYTSIFKDNNKTMAEKEQLVSQLDNIYWFIKNIEDDEQQGKALEFLSTHDLTSASGIADAIAYIESLDLGPVGDSIISSLHELEQKVSINLTTEFANLSSKVVSEMSNFEKAISNATKGMDLKTATEMATKMGKSLSKDFTFENGKYFYENLDDIESAYLPDNSELLKVLEERKAQQIATAKGLTFKKGTFDLNKINDKDYLKTHEAEFIAAGYGNIEEVYEQLQNDTEVEDIEFFDIDAVNEDYLENWRKEIENLGYNFNEVKNYALGLEGEKISASDWGEISQLSRSVIYNPREDLLDFASTLSESNYNIDTMIKTWGGNLKDIENEIDSSDALEGVEGLDKSTLKSYIKMYLSSTAYETGVSFDKWLEDYLNELYADNKTEIERYTKDQKARAYLTNNNIKGFVKTVVDKNAIKEAVQNDAKFQQASQEEINAEIDRRYQEQSDKLTKAIVTGDIDSLDPELQQYAKLIYDTFKSTQQSVMNSMFEAVSGGETKIFADDKNIEVLKQFADKGWIKKRGENGDLEEITAKDIVKDGHYEFDTEAFKDGEDKFYKWLDEADLTQKERIEYVKKFFDIKYPNIKASSAALGMLKKDTIATGDLQSYMETIGQGDKKIEKFAEEYGLAMNAWGEWIIEDSDLWFKHLEDQVEQAKDQKEQAKAKAELESAKQQQAAKPEIDLNKAVKDVADNYTSFSEEQRLALETAMGDDYQTISKYISGDVVNGYRIDLSHLSAAISSGTAEVSDATKEAIEKQISATFDAAADQIKSNISLATTGTVKVSEMDAFTKKMNELRTAGFLENEAEYTNNDFFTWNNTTKAYQLNAEAQQAYLDGERARLEELWYSTEQIDAILTKQAAEQIDIKSFITSDGSEQTREIFKNQIQSWLMAKGEDYSEAIVESYVQQFETGGEAAVEAAKEIAADAGKELSAEDMQSYYAPLAEKYTNWASQLAELTVGQYIGEGDFRDLLESVEIVDDSGVITSIENMVEAYKAIYDKIKEGANATTSQINAVYAQYLTAGEQDEINAIEFLSNAMEMSYGQLGEFLSKYDEDLETWLNDNDELYEKIGNGKIRITDFHNFASRFGWDFGSEEYYNALSQYNDALISKNKQKKNLASLFGEFKDMHPGDQMNITSIVQEMDQELTDEMLDHIEGIVEQTNEDIKESLEEEVEVNGKKKKIKDLLEGSKEEGYKVKQGLNKEEQAAGHEILKKFKKRAGQALQQARVSQQLETFGATLENGILTFGENANILGIAQTLASVATAKGTELSREMAELADTITDIIKSYTDAIKKGISGGLSQTESYDLQNIANSLGISNLSFNKTAEGLKLSQESAIALYSALQKVDALQATLVFDELNNSLRENNEAYQSISSILEHMGDLQEKINTADGTVSLVRQQQYQQELDLANEILRVRSTTEDSSFNFMSNKIPGAQNNPINYYQNWAQAFSKIREGLNQKVTTTNRNTNKKELHQGLIDYQDWYNIITEMGHLAEQSGEIKLSADLVLKNSEDAAKLIEAGAQALTVDKNGNVKVALSDIAGLGIDFKTGAQDMAKAVDLGIHDLAESQVSMLDGLIALLEAIVAFEALGDIDVDGMGIDLSDIFTITYDQKDASIATLEFTEGYKAWRDDIVKKIEEYNKDNSQNKDLVEALESIKLNIDGSQFSLKDMIQWDESAWKDKGELTSVYASLVNSLVQAAKSGNYDLDNIAASVQQELASAGIFNQPINIDVGDTTLFFSAGDHVEIRWKDESIQKLIKIVEADGKDGQKYLTTLLSNYMSGQTIGEQEIKYILAIKKKVVLDDKGQVTEVIYNGKTYKAEDYDETQFKGFISAAALEDQGIAPKDITINEGKAKTTITYKTGIVRQVESSIESGTVWASGLTNKTYSNEDAMMADEYQFYSDAVDLANQHGAGVHKQTENEWKFQVYGKRAVIKPQFSNTEGEVDLSKDPESRQQIRDIVAGGVEGVQKYIDENQSKLVENEDGTWTIDLGKDLKFTFSGEEGNGTEAYEALMQSLGFDATMVDSIVAGITQAMSGEKVAGALGTAIATGLSADGVEIPAITINPENLGLAEGSGDKLQEAVKAAAADLKADIHANTEPLKADVAGVVLPPLTVDVKGNYIGTTGLPSTIDKPGSGGGGSDGTGPKREPWATGSIGLAKAQGTLMGELGPELVVSNGHYFVAGQNGPEMVNLADDAIVFNHLQTKSLLEKGMSRGRGQAVTNERNAVSFATGNIHGGPAMASASAALAALKQLRAQWQALAGMSAQDLAGKGGGGGGGGGDPKAFIKELERWYNYLQKIAQLEKEISLEEAKRTTYASSFSRTGKDYYTSQVESLKKLKEQLATQIALNTEQEAYFNKRRKELNENSAFKALYQFDENGQLKYKDGKFEQLSELSGRDSVTGEANYTAEEQYNKLVAMGYADQMKFDSSGNEIKQEGADWYATAVQAFWDKIEAERQEMQELHDSIEDGKQKSQELQNQQNEILREIEDNQIAVEQKVLKAIEESRQRQIDELQEQRDAIEESSNKLIDGLSEQLSKEQEMYDNQQQSDDLAKLQRQLQILQRSGGSASQIADLQSQIAEKQQDMYFEMQQQQIDALQEASDNQLERLDHQIDIMTEQLAYEKENGLLWDAVYEVLQGSPEQIAQFIQDNTSEYWGKSPTDLAQTLRQDLFEIDRFKEQQKDISEGVDLLKLVYNEEVAQLEQEQKRKENEDYIRGLYKDLLGREAGDEEVAGWAEKMAQGMSAEDVKKGFLESYEYGKKHPKEYVANLYKTLLGREGSESEIQSWADQIANGSKSAADVRQGFLNSAEYKKKNGITDNTSQSNTNNKNNSQPVYGYYALDDKGKQTRFIVVKPDQVKTEKDATGKTIYKQKNTGQPLIKHAKGGYNYETGLAWLDGTKDNPEAVLNPEQTRILRNNILSSRPDSLVSLLKSYNEAYHGLSASTYDSISNNTNNATVIERAEVNLQVAQLANDYDSRRAANTIMDEMLRIASKTSANNSVRR